MSRNNKKKLNDDLQNAEQNVLVYIRNIFQSIVNNSRRGSEFNYVDESKANKVYFKLSSENYDVFGENLKKIEQLLNVTPFQALFFSIVFESSIRTWKSNNNVIAEKMQCSVLDIILNYRQIEEMLEKGLIEASFEDNDFFESNLSNTSCCEYSESDYFVPNHVITKIVKNEPLEFEQENFSDEELLDLFVEIICNNKYPAYWKQIVFKAKTTHSSVLCKKIIEISKVLSPISICMLIIMTMHRLENKPTDMETLASDVCSRLPLARRLILDIYRGKNELVKNGYICFAKADIIKNHTLELTPKGKAVFLDFINIKTDTEVQKINGLIMADDIREKTMYYNDRDKIRIDEINDVLKEENYREWKKRLNEKNMPEGITILLYGPPGTGKTESVWQIAKQTGRSVKMIDAAGIKSMWFGGTEKNIKEVFQNYRSYLPRMELAPILLFNEADGIFGKRKNVGSSNVAQTENTMQNIILQEMEKFQGILIATTNLTSNLDSAFERRFLLKVNLSPPQPHIGALIWLQFFPWISNKDAESFAIAYRFSGAQIENIARKCLVHELREGAMPEIQLLHEFCSEERIENKTTQIGFK